MSQVIYNSEPPPFAGLAGVLSYLVPGLGQIIQGRVGKGLLFMVCLLGLFHVGQEMGGWRNVYLPVVNKDGRLNLAPGGFNARNYDVLSSVYNRWQFAGQFFIGAAAWPAIWQFYDMKLPDKEEHPFWYRYQRGPREQKDVDEIDNQTVSSDKSVDLGWVITVIAGVLNVLVIYDAAAGPAYGRGMTPKPAAPAEALETSS